MTMAYIRLCVAANTNKGMALSQYSGFNFNSFGKFGDVYLGFNEDGIYELGADDTDDDGDNIDASFEIATSDLGTSKQKRIRSVLIGYETSGGLKLKLKNDGKNERQYIISQIIGGQLQEGHKIGIGRDGKGRYWTFTVENVNGADFSIDSIEAMVNILGSKPSGS